MDLQKLNYKILANTTVRIIMDYSEDMLPLKGVKNPTASKRIGFTDWKRNKSLNYSGDEDSADKDIPIKVQDKQDKQDKQEIELEALKSKVDRRYENKTLWCSKKNKRETSK